MANQNSAETLISDFFKPAEKVPFPELPTVMMTGCATLAPGTNIDTEALFNNVEIYDIPGWNRGKNKHVKIPYPGLPYVVVSAKKGKSVRGIVKHLSDVEKKPGIKLKFGTQVFLDVSLKDKLVNIMVYPNMFKVAGATKPEHIVESFVFIQALLVYMQNQGVKVFDAVPILTNVDVVMENVVFNLGFKILKQALVEKARAKGLSCPSESEAVRICYPMDKEKAKGGHREYNFRVQSSGKVVFSGDNRKAMEPVYNKFIDFIMDNESDIRFC